MMTAADNFIRGKPAVYSGFDGKLYVATFLDGQKNGLGAPQLQVTGPDGEVVRDVIFSETDARNFFWNLDARDSQ